MEKGKWVRRARIALYVVGLIIFLELSSSLVLNNLISPMRMERFDTIFLKEPTEYWMLPHPYLGWVESRYLNEQERYLNRLGKDRTDRIYVVALGGSTTGTGYPTFTEQYLDTKLDEINSSLKVTVFNFGVSAWSSLTTLQNYVYLLRYLHPDIVVIHHNVNDLKDRELFRQSVLYYPQISRWEKTLIRNSGFYRLLKFAYILSYNPIRYGTGVVDDYESGLNMQARISSYLNENNPNANPLDFFRSDFTGGKSQLAGISFEFLLAETHESLINYARADNSTLIMTTQYLNYSKDRHRIPFVFEEEQRQSRDINNILRNVSRQHTVPLVDLDAKMEEYDHLLLEDGVHFNEEGIRLKGELIGEAIFRILAERYNLTN